MQGDCIQIGCADGVDARVATMGGFRIRPAETSP